MRSLVAAPGGRLPYGGAGSTLMDLRVTERIASRFFKRQDEVPSWGQNAAEEGYVTFGPRLFGCWMAGSLPCNGVLKFQMS